MKFAAALLLLVAAPVLAQEVGYPPDKSPYQDLQAPQRITVFGGYFLAGKDGLGAQPHSAPMVGIRYEITVAGPAQFFARVGYIASQRNSYNPTEIESNKAQGLVNVPLYMTDVGFAFNLTGKKTWHHFVPSVGLAAGIVDGSTRAANDPYSFGTQFEVSTDFSIRYNPRNSWELRVNAGNMLYNTRYPTAYFSKATDGTSLLGTDASRSSYRNNWMFTGGVSFPIFR